MTLTGALRTLAIATALVGLLDPSWTARRPAPVSVELRAGQNSGREAEDVRRRLVNSMKADVTFDSDADPAAVVLVGGADPMATMTRDDVPISTVAIASPAAPNARIVSAGDPDPVRVGWAATLQAVVEGRGLAGRTSRIVLEDRGAELASLEHKWTGESERFAASLRYTPPASGTSTITLRVVPLAGESTAADNAADLRLVASGRRMKVLIHEPRPSWNTSFVRRALEQDESFDVSALVQASKGLEVRAGTPPAALTSDALNVFDAVVVGAPEELRASEIDALRAFARRRGGAVVLLPDRRPSGAYLELVPAQFDEVLVETPIELRSIAGPPLRATELAVPRGSVPGSEMLASIDYKEQSKGARAVVLEWPVGEGRILFSGAMDAWRYRAAADDGFGRFWRARIAEAAQAAPAMLEASVTPGVARPGEDVTIRVRLRATELEESRGRTRTPALRARLVARDGAAQIVRLWPASEPGVFAGHIPAPAAGTYDLQVTATSGVTVDEVLTVVGQANHAAGDADDTAAALRSIAQSTGGVAVTTADLAPLERYLRGLSGGEVERVVHPARSFVMVIAFAILLSAEWTIRRRRGRA